MKHMVLYVICLQKGLVQLVFNKLCEDDYKVMLGTHTISETDVFFVPREERGKGEMV